MTTPLSEVKEVINALKSDTIVFANENVTDRFAKLGVVQASIDLDEDWDIVNGEITADLTSKQAYLCGLHAFRNFAMNKHSEATEKATNFKTLNFAVSGLTEKAKEAMRIVWWCDGEILKTNRSLNRMTGYSTEMAGDDTDG